MMSSHHNKIEPDLFAKIPAQFDTRYITQLHLVLAYKSGHKRPNALKRVKKCEEKQNGAVE